MKEDKRIIKTRVAIHEAFLELLKTRGFHTISIKDLTDKAGVNRKTFYNHYNNLYDIMEEVEKEAVTKLTKVIHTHSTEEYISSPTLFFRIILKELDENGDYYRLITNTSKTSFLQKLEDHEKAVIMKAIGGTDTEGQQYLEYLIQFVLAGTSAVFTKWLSSNGKIPAEDIAVFLGSFVNEKETKRFIKK